MAPQAGTWDSTSKRLHAAYLSAAHVLSRKHTASHWCCCQQVGARLLLDCCQSVPNMPVDVQAMGADWIVASAHKMCGPTGIGFLWGRCANPCLCFISACAG